MLCLCRRCPLCMASRNSSSPSWVCGHGAPREGRAAALCPHCTADLPSNKDGMCYPPPVRVSLQRGGQQRGSEGAGRTGASDVRVGGGEAIPSPGAPGATRGGAEPLCRSGEAASKFLGSVRLKQEQMSARRAGGQREI